MKYFILPMIFFFQFSYAVEEEITSWFNQESEKFLEIMNNSDGQNNENYDDYIKFIEKNFAVKSIAYGLIPESVLSKSDKSSNFAGTLIPPAIVLTENSSDFLTTLNVCAVVLVTLIAMLEFKELQNHKLLPYLQIL